VEHEGVAPRDLRASRVRAACPGTRGIELDDSDATRPRPGPAAGAAARAGPDGDAGRGGARGGGRGRDRVALRGGEEAVLILLQTPHALLEQLRAQVQFVRTFDVQRGPAARHAAVPAVPPSRRLRPRHRHRSRAAPAESSGAMRRGVAPRHGAASRLAAGASCEA
jgi:hypothetical protein